MSGPPSALRPVVTGLGVISALGPDVEAFAEGLCRGRSGIVKLGADSHGPAYAAPIPAHAHQDPWALPGIPVELAQATERVTARSPRPVKVSLAATVQGWLSAGLHQRPVDPDRVALVVAGSNLTSRQSHDMQRRYAVNLAYVPPRHALHMFDTDHVGTISHVLGLTGEGFTAGGASAGGNVAIVAGCRLVESGAADVCLVVGALAQPSPLEIRALANLGALAWGEPGAPFDESRAGFVLGEGAACLVVEAAESACARAATVHAVVAGYAQRLDGNSLADPSEAGEVAVMARALSSAGARPTDVDYVNAHATGSQLGDLTEARALRHVFGDQPGPWVNATKGLVGHCLGAAGVVEAVATVVQLRDGFVHANPGLQRPIDEPCRFVGPVSQPVDGVRLALSNSFGFGGFNTCIAFAAPAAPTPEDRE